MTYDTDSQTKNSTCTQTTQTETKTREQGTQTERTTNKETEEITQIEANKGLEDFLKMDKKPWTEAAYKNTEVKIGNPLNTRASVTKVII